MHLSPLALTKANRLSFLLAAGLGFLGLFTQTQAADLSPAFWPKEERARLEKQESQTWSPFVAQTVEGHQGIISAAVSPIAVYAGIQALKQGGSAADAAATVALTQISTELGSVVSYAGIFTMVYYDAKSGKVSSLDAGYNSYLHETDPATIPLGDLGPLSFGRKASENGARGRETLVPGFMAGLEAMHSRFGHLAFKELFAPAIWYDEHGVIISPVLASFFTMRETRLARTEEGRRFLSLSGKTVPQMGDLFIQPELAATLTAISEQGSRYMYQGDWAHSFANIIQREGGKVTLEDLRRYQPNWSEPYKTEVFGHTVYTNGAPHFGAFGLITGLNLAEAMQLDKRGPYWEDPDAFQAFAQIVHLTARSPLNSPDVDRLLKSRGIANTPAAQLSKTFAQAIVPLIPTLFAPSADNGPHHSNCIVVMDTEGNIAAITHTINAVVWGDTGIVVGGIPIPDSAAFQQAALAAVEPGGRLPHTIVDTIVFKGDRPVLATASIGSSLLAESQRVLVGVLAQHQSLKEVMAAPPLLANFDPVDSKKPIGERSSAISNTGYSADFIARLKEKGVHLKDVSAATTDALRGTVSAIAIDPVSGTRSTVEQAGVMVYSQSQ